MRAETRNAFIGVITRYRLPAGWHPVVGSKEESSAIRSEDIALYVGGLK